MEEGGIKKGGGEDLPSAQSQGEISMKGKSKSSGLNENMSNTPAEKELEKLYRKFTPLFKNLAPDEAPRIMVQHNGGRRHALGWFAAEQWIPPEAEVGEPLVHEITITAESLNRSVEDIICTLLHEMTHYSNYVAGIKDVGTDHRYHNQRFKEKAESVGLLVGKDQRLGWSVTTASTKLREKIEQLNVNAHALSAFRVQPAEREKAPTKMKKWMCTCPVNVRCAVELTATCTSCGYTFANVERGEVPRLATVPQQPPQLPVQDIAGEVDHAATVAALMTQMPGTTDGQIEDLNSIVDYLETALELLGVEREEIPIEPARPMESVNAIPV
jgi:hypothetical protein